MKNRRLRTLKGILAFLISFVILLFLILALLPKGPRDPMIWDDPIQTDREALYANEYAVVAGTPWASEAALQILEKGGNAFDAAVAGVLALNATFGEAASFPGVAPTMVYIAAQDRYLSYIGAGTAPEAATIAKFTEAGEDVIPDFDIRAQLLPASPDVLLNILKDHGSMSFAEVAAPAIKLAQEGFPVHTVMKNNLDFSLTERIGIYFIMPTTADYYLRGQWWRPIHYKDRFTRPELAETWAKMAEIEAAALADGGDREQSLEAVRDYFYKGEIAEAIVEFHKENDGLFTAEDLANYQGGWEEPWSAEIGEFQIHTNQGWSQGIVVPLALGILSKVDLASMEHNSPEYTHTVLQAIELAMADREAYVGDPAFVDVPYQILLSEDYWQQRAAAMTSEAFGEMPEPGFIEGYEPASPVYSIAQITAPGQGQLLGDFAIGRDTSQIVVVDAEGNAVAITPSDFPKSPMLPEWGLNLGNRMVQFRLDADHPAALEPGKRPRITPHAVIIEQNEHPYLVFNTPGGDMQAQALIQVYLNLTVFGMNLQNAIEAPRFRSHNFPDSFSPHNYQPGQVSLESEIYREVGSELTGLGYKIKDGGEWSNSFSAVGAILYDDGTLIAGSDPREATTAVGH